MEKGSSVLIVEDEVIIAETIADILRGSGFTNIRMAESVEEALMEIDAYPPSIILTDINLGQSRTGIDLGHMLNTKYRIPFIYITSYSSAETVNKAKHTRPSAYIIKPFKQEDLLVAIELALFNSNTKYQNTNNEQHVLMVKEGRAITTLSFSNIMWVEAVGDYSSISVSNGKKRLIRHSMRDIEQQLNSRPFMRIHDSFLINCSYITETRNRSIVVNGCELPIGKNYEAVVSNYFHC
jgi:two-component system, LytTR family, response regulator LytT